MIEHSAIEEIFLLSLWDMFLSRDHLLTTAISRKHPYLAYYSQEFYSIPQGFNQRLPRIRIEQNTNLRRHLIR
jgi:hypothetical protein